MLEPELWPAPPVPGDGGQPDGERGAERVADVEAQAGLELARFDGRDFRRVHRVHLARVRGLEKRAVRTGKHISIFYMCEREREREKTSEAAISRAGNGWLAGWLAG